MLILSAVIKMRGEVGCTPWSADQAEWVAKLYLSPEKSFGLLQILASSP